MRMRTYLFAAVIGCSLMAAQTDVKQFSIVIDKPDTQYTIEVGGTVNPENVELEFENVGNIAAVNPRMTVNGLYDWYDVKSIVAEVTRDCKTDEEKAMALWSWVLYKRYQLSPGDHSALHPVRAMNGYGYGICGHTSAWMKCLLTAAGIQARVQELWGHTVSEASWDGAWHMLDANVKVFYPGRDNRTIASLAMLERDRFLIERGLHPRDPWTRRPDTKELNDELVNYIVTNRDNYEENSYDGEIAKDYNMAMMLRPGEKLVRWWEPRLGKHERGTAQPPQRYANAQLIWEPDLRRIDIRPYLSVPAWGNIATRAQDRRGPAIHVANLQDKLYTRPAVFTLPVSSPYPIVGGRIQGVMVKEGASPSDLLSVFFGQPGWRRGDLFNSRRESGKLVLDVDLDPSIGKARALYGYGIGFAIRGNAESTPPTQAGLDSFRLVTDLQVSPHAVPALSLGKNTVRFWHASPGAAMVRITHRWSEIHDRRPPAVVEAPLSPGNGEQIATLAPALKWTPPIRTDPSAKVADYQVMVSLRPDCRWPVSPTLYQSVGSETAEWTVPASFLNPGTTYYWRVRARDSRGDIGEWSQPFRFTTASNAR